MYIPDIFKIFAKFFLLVTHCFLLSESPSVCFLWCGLVSIHAYWFLCLRSLWLCGPGCLFLLCACPALSVCLQAPVLLSGSTLVLVPWFPWYYPCQDVHVLLACQLLAGGKVRVVEQHIVGDRFKLGLLLGWGALLYTVAYICSWSPNIICF